MEFRGLALFLILAGAAVVVIGLLLAAGWLGWFGRLPGDIRFSAGSTRVFIPLTSMLLVSLVLTLLINLLRRLL
jgi:hypothetical protein